MPEPDDDHVALERARLEAIAYGPGSTEAEAARARIALTDLARGRRGVATGREAPHASASPDPSPGRSGSARRDPAPGRGRDGDASPDVVDVPGGGRADESSGALAGSGRIGDTAVPTGSVARADGPSDADPEWRSGSTRGDGTPAAGSDAPRGDAGDETGAPTGATVSDGGGAGLQADDARAASRTARLVRWLAVRLDTRRGWVIGGAVAAVAIAFASGIAVGAVRPAMPGATVPTPTDGAITLTQLLDAPQTFADQLPGAIDVPVVLHSTRLVFTNRSLAGDDANTPWNVWAGVGKDRSEICLVASADRISATAGCYPKDAVLAGKVSLAASTASGQLVVRVVGGVVSGSVSSTY